MHNFNLKNSLEIY